MKKVHKKRYL